MFHRQSYALYTHFLLSTVPALWFTDIFLSLASGIFFQSTWDHVPLGSHILRTQIWVWNSRATEAGIPEHWVSGFCISNCFEHKMYLSIFGCRQVMNALLTAYPFFILHFLVQPLLSLFFLLYYDYIFCWFRDYTNPYLPVAPSAIDGNGQV